MSSESQLMSSSLFPGVWVAMTTSTVDEFLYAALSIRSCAAFWRITLCARPAHGASEWIEIQNFSFAFGRFQFDCWTLFGARRFGSRDVVRVLYKKYQSISINLLSIYSIYVFSIYLGKTLQRKTIYHSFAQFHRLITYHDIFLKLRVWFYMESLQKITELIY